MADTAHLPTTYDGPVHIAIIGGTGLSHLPTFTPIAHLSPTTPWGPPSSPITLLSHPAPTASHPTRTITVAFLSRHGLHHQYAPHEVPSRANIAALRKLGVRCLVAFSAVGSLREAVKPRDFVVPDGVVDRTKGVRPWTFFEGGVVGHVGFADPFDANLAGIVAKCAHVLEGEGVKLHEGGTLICMEGPQFSTRAESHLYRSWGGTVINMSCLPEAKLAREAEIAYVMICMSTDYDCWHPTTEAVTVDMVMGHMAANADNARRLVAAVLDEMAKEEVYESCLTGWGLEGQTRFAVGMTKVEGRGKEAVEKLGWLFQGYF